MTVKAGVAIVAVASVSTTVSAQKLPFVGVWNCDVANFTFTEQTYHNGTALLRFKSIKPGKSGDYLISFPDGYLDLAAQCEAQFADLAFAGVWRYFRLQALEMSGCFEGADSFCRRRGVFAMSRSWCMVVTSMAFGVLTPVTGHATMPLLTDKPTSPTAAVCLKWADGQEMTMPSTCGDSGKRQIVTRYSTASSVRFSAWATSPRKSWVLVQASGLIRHTAGDIETPRFAKSASTRSTVSPSMIGTGTTARRLARSEAARDGVGLFRQGGQVERATARRAGLIQTVRGAAHVERRGHQAAHRSSVLRPSHLGNTWI